MLVTVETATPLARAFDTTAELWISLQAHYDLERARRRLTRGGRCGGPVTHRSYTTRRGTTHILT